jgi:hypothetical protein
LKRSSIHCCCLPHRSAEGKEKQRWILRKRQKRKRKRKRRKKKRMKSLMRKTKRRRVWLPEEGRNEGRKKEQERNRNEKREQNLKCERRTGKAKKRNLLHPF